MSTLPYKLFCWLMLILSFCLPLHTRFVPPLVILALLFWIIQRIIYKDILKLFNNRLLLLPVLLYVVLLVSLLYSSSLDVGFSNLETKLTLLIFPIIFTDRAFNSPEFLKSIARWFVTGCSLAVLICYAVAVYRYNMDLDFTSSIFEFPDFYGSRFSVFLHPSYFSLFLSWSILILLTNLKKDKQYALQNILLLLTVSLFFFTVFLMVSTMGMVLLVVTVLAYIFSVGSSVRKLIAVSFLALLVFSVTLVILVKLSPFVENKVLNPVKALTMSTGKDSTDHSSGVRLLIWKKGIKLFGSNLFGLGIGDSRSELVKSYSDEVPDFASEKMLNSHNQFLETALAAGIPGLFVLLAVLLTPFMLFQRNHIPRYFFLLSLFAFCTESMLEIQEGVVFFSFFYCFNVQTLVTEPDALKKIF